MLLIVEFGINSLENRLLKKALLITQYYLQGYAQIVLGSQAYFTGIVNFCRPAFDQVGDQLNIAELKAHKSNPFFAEYTEAMTVGRMILKRFAYTVSKTASDLFKTPPYWTDMPRLFELYVYHLLKLRFPAGIKEL